MRRATRSAARRPSCVKRRSPPAASCGTGQPARCASPCTPSSLAKKLNGWARSRVHADLPHVRTLPGAAPLLGRWLQLCPRALCASGAQVAERRPPRASSRSCFARHRRSPALLVDLLSRQVPYDCCLPMLFQGEEIEMAVRAWTFGYDFYAPRASVAFHPYSRKSKPHMFWENGPKHRGEEARSAARAAGIIHMAPPKPGDPQEQAPEQHAATGDVGRYGLGSRRSAEDFMRIFGLDVQSRTVTRDLCSWSTSGAMHRQLTPRLRPDKRGIDYGQVAFPDQQRAG